MVVKSLSWKDLAPYYDSSGNLSQEVQAPDLQL
jgi:hypothetical protein